MQCVLYEGFVMECDGLPFGLEFKALSHVRLTLIDRFHPYTMDQIDFQISFKNIQFNFLFICFN